MSLSFFKGLCFFTLVCFTDVALADDLSMQELIPVPVEKNLIHASEKKIILTVGFSETDYPPYNFEKDGIYQGFTIDILNYIESKSEFSFKFIKLPWPRVLQSVKKGDVDLIATLFKTKPREGIYAFIEPAYGFEINQFVSLKNKRHQYSGDLTSLTELTIGTVREYSYGKAFDQADFLNKRAVIDEGTLVKLLLGQRVDLIIGNPMTFFHILKHEFKSESVEMLNPIVERSPVYFALTKQREDYQVIQQELEQLVIQFKQSKAYQQLFDKYHLLPDYRPALQQTMRIGSRELKLTNLK